MCLRAVCLVVAGEVVRYHGSTDVYLCSVCLPVAGEVVRYHGSTDVYLCSVCLPVAVEVVRYHGSTDVHGIGAFTDNDAVFWKKLLYLQFKRSAVYFDHLYHLLASGVDYDPLCPVSELALFSVHYQIRLG